MTSLLQRSHPLAAAATQRQQIEGTALRLRFDDALARSGLRPLVATRIETLQINVGKLCNQTCRHCHVDAGPDRRESMPSAVVDACLRALESGGIPKLDITGGAPELIRSFATSYSALGHSAGR
jgi:2-iminoacetate synthase ThiH